ncbi:hypothetical protein BP6252_09376 [Coleophoma cylindrospora]|uniref:Polynucleotide 5'-hydroxyl-kinase GRC3 n=1 Tax=Coleophoma cylindrospora TaxID=1849047 RepID=A0A3D8R206_9HELO|nr:hypothetical protein BP6252_09376 [Coleophoma cylindrospora]
MARSCSKCLLARQRLVILGRFEMLVSEGQVTLLGASLKKSPTTYRVYASLSHSLPVVRVSSDDVNGAMISLRQCDDGLPLLEQLSPLFGKLWNDRPGLLGSEPRSLVTGHRQSSSFQILFSSEEGPKKAYLQPVISPPEWNAALARLSIRNDRTIPIILICGPKSSGKSTFAKLLSNKLLTMDRKRSSDSQSGIAVLDLDPGQPEYSIPGQLSLVHLLEPNFGPPYTHPIPSNMSHIIRAHTVAAITPSLDPALYMSCALDLFAHYKDHLSKYPDCPLVINTAGWVLGTGLEILEELISRIKPTEVVYMSQEGPLEVTKSLRDAVKKSPLLELPSQISEFTTRTAAHLRTMQYMSYFHMDPYGDNGPTWGNTPLTSVPPWEISYGGQGGILGIMCYGEQPPTDLLLDAINGSMVAIVVIDDMAAIPGWKVTDQESTNEVTTGRADPDLEMDDIDIRAFDDKSYHSQDLTQPLIVRTPHEALPYFNPSNTITLDPRYSNTIGLALIRGIDIPRQRLQILTPIPASEIETLNSAGKSVVLVSGKFDTPGWAYTEELIQRTLREKRVKEVKDAREARARKKRGAALPVEEVVDTDEDATVLGDATGTVDAPWVERLEGSQGRGVGAKVWRVRRDLGKSDGGE